eukprot:Skav200854  [mRNA]  locus=scaffold2484:104625:105347:+ [translate_table: standard]
MPLTIDPAINMWDQSQWNAMDGRFSRSMASALPGIKLRSSSSPWTVPLPDPLSFDRSFGSNPFVEESWEFVGEPSEPRYVQLGHLDPFSQPAVWPLEQPRSMRALPSERAAFGAIGPQDTSMRHLQQPCQQGSIGPMVSPLGMGSTMASLESAQAVTGRSSKFSPLREDPGLSGQRLKRVLHVKQAPIYKYAEWCSHWLQKGGRTSDDPMTPRSELTKSEFDIQYGAWRKALVEGPPKRA